MNQSQKNAYAAGLIDGETIRKRMQELNRKGPDTTSIAPGWFARLVGGIWVTPQSDMFTDLGWASFSQTWPRAGTVLRGVAYQRSPLVLPTDETEYSLWPTPKATEANLGIRGPNAQGGMGLSEAVRIWPTPTSVSWKGSGPVGSKSWLHDRRKKNLKGAVKDTDQPPGELTPAFTEWLMGFPDGWTDLGD